MKSRRFRALAVALLFAAICGVWLNYVPFVPGRLLVAVPAEATWISTHHDLDDRWDELIANPLVRELVGESLAGSDAGLQRLRSVLRRDTIFAYVPQIGPKRKPAWFLVSWIGARSFQLQWWLNLRPPDTIEHHPVHRGRNYWTVNDRPVAFALEEGMLIACITEDPESILHAMACFDGSAPSAAETDEVRREWLVDPGAPDRGWYRAWAESSDRATRYELTEAGSDRLAIRVHLPEQVLAAGVEGEMSGLAAVQPLFGDLPAGLMHVRADALDVLLGPWSTTSWATEIQTLFREAGGQRVLIGLFGGEYSGRLRGLRVPAIVAVSPVPDEGQALRAAASTLHRLNARQEWGLLMKDIPGESNVIHVVDSASGTAYAEQPTEEKFAFGVVEGCLLVASNYDTLQRLVARRQWASAPTEPGALGVWRVARDASPMAGSFDLERSGKSVRNGLAVYAMTQMMSSRPGASEARGRTEKIKQGVMGIQELGSGYCRLESGPKGAVLNLELGPNE